MLKYVGKGFLLGVPARDLEEKEIGDYGVEREDLIKSGLYVEVKAVIQGSENKILIPTRKNKEKSNARS